MNRLWTIMRKEFFHIWRDPRTLGLILALPALLLILLGYGISGETSDIKLAVADFSKSDSSRWYIDRFTSSNDFELAYDVQSEAALQDLIDFHLDFTLNEPELIRIQDRDLTQLPPAALRQVRTSQRQYVEIWVRVLREINCHLAESDARLMAHAAFGLLNSTPYSTKPAGGKPAGVRSRAVLRSMALAALTARD